MSIKKICLLGYGTIGNCVANIIAKDGMRRRGQLECDQNSVSSIADTLANMEIVSIVSLDDVVLIDELKNAKVTKNAYAAIRGEEGHQKPDIVIELIGGVEPAKTFIIEALKNGCDVVTANKAVLGEEGDDLKNIALKYNRTLLYEAAVGGAVPIVRAIRNSLMGDKIISITGVLNGTTNFILDKMTQEGMSYEVALKQAQSLGFAEADPTADVEGYDPAAKIAILASLAFGRDFRQKDVEVSGITQITQGMIIAGKSQNKVYKLVASAVRSGCGEKSDHIALKVEPQLVSEKSAFGELEGAMNAVEVVSEYSQKLTFFGLGAGGFPTASAVVADVIELCE